MMKKAIPFSDMALNCWLPIVDEIRTFYRLSEEYYFTKSPYQPKIVLPDLLKTI
jgi:hypothetical protein